PQFFDSEEAPPCYLLPLSAKTSDAVAQAQKNLAQALADDTDLSLQDVAYTLQVGRKAFEHRAAVICENRDQAIALLKGEAQQSNAALVQAALEEGHRPVAFLFSGQGSQHSGMAKQLYEELPEFRQTLDDCAEILKPDIDLWALLKGDPQNTAEVQPVLFALEYALAKLWMSWGIQPEAFIGHSLGEYVAACLAGVFSLEDGLKLVTARGQLMQQMRPGAMLSVGLAAIDVKDELPQWGEGLELATVNAPQLCVISGEMEAIAQLQTRLEQDNIPCQLLKTSHGFHSVSMEPMLPQFRKVLESISLNAPQTPILSNVTGGWLTAKDAVDPDYWCRQVRHPVQFHEGIKRLGQDMPESILLEVGPGKTLYSLAKATLSHRRIFHSLPHPQADQPALIALNTALGQLWTLGVPVRWTQVNPPQRRVPLPTYPFERQRHWIEPEDSGLMPEPSSEELPLEDWFYTPTWQRTPSLQAQPLTQQDCWLVFRSDDQIGNAIAQRLEASGQTVISVLPNDSFGQIGYRQFGVNPSTPKDFSELFEELKLRELLPQQVVYFWTESPNAETSTETTSGSEFRNLLSLVQTMIAQSWSDPVQLSLVSDRSFDVLGQEDFNPEASMIRGLSQVLGQEYPLISCRHIDLELSGQTRHAQEQLWADLTQSNDSPPMITAYRGRRRWLHDYSPLSLSAQQNDAAETIRVQSYQAQTLLQKGGCYLIAGDLIRGLGWVWAKFLTEEYQAKLLIVGDASSIEQVKAQSAQWDAETLEITYFETPW
ncbi:MAG: acyltransferase domain-containing protein, partial [Cyanobacteria bacterium P01_F01_bin.42]